MFTKPKSDQNSTELADVFLRYGQTYIEQHGISAIQNKAIQAISRCRTAALGGHIDCCDQCGTMEISYNSCRYRHCPKCQTTKQLRWLEARQDELLPVGYFHVVFTIPHELNGIASYNAAIIYNILFKAAWSVINTLGHDQKRLGGQLGMLALLHTWGQNLSQHIHLHCLIPGGALCELNGQKQWVAARKNYLFPGKVMSKLFGKAFLKLLRQAYAENKLKLQGSTASLVEPEQFDKLLVLLTGKSWNVYAKPPFNGAEGGLEYLANYVSKTAISNERILSCDDNQVTFKWRDYADNNESKIMKLDASEFIRRYLTHILPNGFMRIRSYGFLANAYKDKSISIILELLQAHKNNDLQSTSNKESIAELMLRVTGLDIDCCKHCGTGRLITILEIPMIKLAKYRDTS